MTDVSVVIATIPPRATSLVEVAVPSVTKQTYPVNIVVETDVHGEGAAPTRNKGIERVETEWLAFLDDDDMMYPEHIEKLMRTAQDTGADLVYPWFDIRVGADLVVANEFDPLAAPWDGVVQSPCGKPYGDEQREYMMTLGNFIPITVLVKTELVKAVGGFPVPGSERWPHSSCEDWGLWQDLLRQGATFVHHPERTWAWIHHHGHTSGQSWKGPRTTVDI